MKKIIVTEEQYNHILKEMAYPTSFNMDEFKSLPTFAARIRYCENRLERISAYGSSRIVYKIDDEKVLKLAKNKKGVAQNEVEGGDYYLQQLGCCAKVYDVDDNYLWIEMQLARKVKPSDFKRLTGYDWNTMCAWINYCWKTHKGNRATTGFYVDPKYIDLFESEEWENMLEDYGVFYAINDYIGCYDLGTPNDLKRLSSWGVVTENGEEELVLIDYGLNNEVWNTYYEN